MRAESKWYRTIEWAVLGVLCIGSLSAGVAQAQFSRPPEPPTDKGLPPLLRTTYEPEAVDCAKTHARAAELLKEFNDAVPATTKSEAEQYVAPAGSEGGPAKAWGDFAAGALLTGDKQAAVWAGLRAAELDWNGYTTTNAGIYFYHLGRVPEALQLLHCAYAMGYRSPYLLEALATLHHKQGNAAEARLAIAQAQQMAPGDQLIDVEAAIIHTGQPPPRPKAPARTADAWDALLETVELYAREAMRELRTDGAVLDRLYPKTRPGRVADSTATLYQSSLDIARQRIGEARAQRDPFMREMLRNTALRERL